MKPVPAPLKVKVTPHNGAKARYAMARSSTGSCSHTGCKCSK